MEEKINEEITVEEPTEEEKKEGKAAAEVARQKVKVPEFDPDKAAESVKRGKLKLKEPIRDGDREYTELEYDFGKLRGIELAKALDFGSGTGNTFSLNNVQALNYFASAAAKCQEAGGLDETDIRERIGAEDAFKGIQLATVFFRASSRAGDSRLLKA